MSEHREQRDPNLGYISRRVYEGDKIHLEIDGRNLGFIEIAHLPYGNRARITLAFDRAVRIVRREDERQEPQKETT